MQVFNENRMIAKNKQEALIALRKSRSLLAKIISMTESESYCIDVIQQILAAQGLLHSAKSSLLENHFKSCFAAVFESKNRNKQKKMTDELLKIFSIKK